MNLTAIISYSVKEPAGDNSADRSLQKEETATPVEMIQVMR